MEIENAKHIAIIGDVHSNISNVRKYINDNKDLDYLFCVGDLELFLTEEEAKKDKKAYKCNKNNILKNIKDIENNAFEKFSIPVYVIPGNHEDYENMFSKTFKDLNIHYLQLGEIVTIDKINIMGFGGIYSPIARLKTREILKNEIRGNRFYTNAEIELALQKSDIQILITHQAPTCCIPTKRYNVDEGSIDLRRLLQLDPAILIHGHHHFEYRSDSPFLRASGVNYDIFGLGNFGKNIKSAIKIKILDQSITIIGE